MLTKHVYYENLKDFVDEQLCSVASKISEKTLVNEKNEQMREKHEKLTGWIEAAL